MSFICYTFKNEQDYDIDEILLTNLVSEQSD